MEAELKFERENREGVATVGSYLIDGARRLGVEVEAQCGRLGVCDSCAVVVKGGGDCLSGLTKAENDQLSAERRAAGERLSCQAKIEKAGEISILTHEKKDPRAEEEKRHEEFRREFDALPLEKKISRLVELEAVALGETFNFVLNSPYKIGEKIIDLLGEFGLKIDRAEREARRPEEHREEEKKKETNSGDSESEDKKSQAKKTKKTDETVVDAIEPEGPEQVKDEN
jgi:ferredoxin